ncbi:MAG: alanine--tRNA ligase [Bacteroidia bacterium]|nr:alanine--tRNA ligase [Bacteroidia bacterium]
MKTGTEIRNAFLKFFEQKLHQIVESAPIVVKNDPTLMFTNAGMNQFKDLFLGLKNPEYRRIADTQKCLRVSGKHNDLDEVGHDTYHHTMFEMLGNWSIGDYYKQESIEWAWELLTEVYKLDKDRLYVSVFGGDKEDGLPVDLEAEEEWKKWVSPDRILHFGKGDNFWEMGEVGPSGPCSEIHIDLRSDEERKKIDGKELVNADHPEVVEIWNLVFIQFNRKADRSLEELPEKHIDTGMGFERLTMALQNKKSTYDTDIFDLTREFLETKTDRAYENAPEDERIAMRVIVDHIRAIVFTIADGQLPSNTGAGYVIRRILRRASRYGFSYLDLKEPFMFQMVELLAEQYEGVFPEVRAQKDFLERIIKQEEESFLRTLDSGTQQFEKYLSDKKAEKDKRVDGEFAFKLYDTFGFPYDLTDLMAREKGWSVDEKGFDKLLQEQKERSRAATSFDTGDWVVVNPSEDLPVFVGYDTLHTESRILSYRTVKMKKKELFQIVLEETPFYAESGGQVGDKGKIEKDGEVIRIIDTKKENELIVHIADKLPKNPAGLWTATVNGATRGLTSSNHTATHLMHAALREVLGTHVEQRGSLVNEKLLRFDFSHFQKVTDEELGKVEKIVNEKIAANIPLAEHRSMPIDDAKAMGAMALFGEKYGDQVRVIVFDPEFSVELCGGTHVPQTSDIRLFKFASEGSVASGIRRVEAYTSDHAYAYLDEKAQKYDQIASLMKNPKDLEKAIADLAEKNRMLEKEIQQMMGEKVQLLKEELKAKVEKVGEINVIRSRVSLGSSDALKQLSFELKKITENTLIVLGAAINDKPLLSVIMSDDLAESKTYNAGQMIRELAKEIKGGGGGQPFYATAGGKDINGLDKALRKVEELVQ